MNAQQTPPGAARSAPLLRLHLFGGFRATRDGGPALAEHWPRQTAQALVKLLAVTPGHRLHREQILDLCWPDTEPQAATNSLRVALHAARRALEPELAPRAISSYLVSDGAQLLLAPATVRVDADQAEEAARSALASGDVAELEKASEQFEGELLPEDRYAGWAERRRRQLSALQEEIRVALASAFLEQGDLPKAEATAASVLSASPAEEVAHRILMNVYLRQGLRLRAVRQYHVCRDALETELGVRPGPETEQLHRAALAAEPALATTTRPALPAPLRGSAASPLHGRDDLLRDLLTDAGPPVRLLTGEAGVGKTRLASEAARRAADAGCAVLWGAGHDAEGHTPYGVFAEALDGWLAEQQVTARARVGAEYPELVAFLPSLGQAHGLGERSPEEARDRLFRATAGLLGELASVRPVWLVLDDMQAADEGSYQLLSHLARRAGGRGPRLRFLVTYRDEDLSDTDSRRAGVRALLRQGLAVGRPVRRLGKADCLAVARDAGGSGDTERLERVWALSLGNPLFAVELSRGLAGSAAESVAPDGVRQLVAERLARLDPDTRRMVEALSVAGPETASSELLDVIAHGLHPAVAGAAATAALERAIAAGFVEERLVVVAGRHEPGLAFRHPLVRLTCYETLTALRRRQLHAAFAQAVRRRRPDAVDTLASHFARAHDPRAAEYLRRAAERAAALYANDTADHYYRDLVARLDADAARARLAHAQVLRRMGQFERATDALRAALDEFVRRNNHDLVVLAAGHLAETLVKAGAPAAGRQVLRDHPVTADTAPEAASVHRLALSVVCAFEGRYDDGHAAARQALPAAHRVPGGRGQGLLARSYALQATNLGLAGRFEQAREAGDLALEPAETYGDPTLLGTVLSMLRENARRAGRLREAVGFGERALDLAEQSGDPTATAFEQANLAELWLLLNESDTASVLATASVTGAEADGSWCLPYALAAQARAHLHVGDLPSAAATLDLAARAAAGLEDRQAAYEVRTARAELALHTDRPGHALYALGGYATDAPVLAAWAHLLDGRAESAYAIARKEADRATVAGERLAEVEARVVLGVGLCRLDRAEEGAAELAGAGSLAAALPYPAGALRVEQAQMLLREAGHRTLTFPSAGGGPAGTSSPAEHTT
ncbi:AAA family ATPase [Streptomyces sp. NPDC048295]|uniref:ATP-binding protein n=1 Tax=Streptomyces sp. NPDC048295 TaxID=3154617 RepID=UPI0034274D11